MYGILRNVVKEQQMAKVIRTRDSVNKKLSLHGEALRTLVEKSRLSGDACGDGMMDARKAWFTVLQIPVPQ